MMMGVGGPRPAIVQLRSFIRIPSPIPELTEWYSLANYLHPCRSECVRWLEDTTVARSLLQYEVEENIEI